MAMTDTESRLARLEEWRDLLKPHCDEHEKQMNTVVMPAVDLVKRWDSKLDRVLVGLVLALLAAAGGWLYQLHESQVRAQTIAEVRKYFAPEQGDTPAIPNGYELRWKGDTRQ